MKKKLAYIFASLFLFLSFYSLTKLYFQSGFPYTHDGENHLARFANYQVALREGQFPPRLAPNLMNHYGYPVFNYNYPLANILSLPFSFFKINYETTFKVIMIGGVLALTGSMLYGLSLKRKLQPWHLVLIGIFLQAPYLYNLIYYRGNIGELLAMTLMVLNLQLIRHQSLLDEETQSSQLEKKRRWLWLAQCTTLTLFFLSHNIMVLIGTPVLLAYSLFRRGQFKLFRSQLIGWGLAFGLSLWFWWPALAEKNLVILDQAGLSQDFLQHFPTLSQLISSPLGFGFSQVGSLDGLSFGLGLSLVILAVMAQIFLGKFVTQRSLNQSSPSYQSLLKVQIFWVLLVLITFIIQLEFSTPLYKFIPFLNFVQFPWRFGAIFFVSLFFLLQEIWLYFPRWSQILVLSLSLFLLTQLLQLRPADYFHRQIIDYQAFSQSTSTADENLPQTWHYTDFTSGWQPNITLVPPEAGQSEPLLFNTSHKKYKLHLNLDATVIEPTMFFPGFQTRITPILCPECSFAESKHYPAVYTDSELIAGRLAYNLVAGDYEIETKFTQRTPARIMANAVTLLSLVSLITLFFFFPQFIWPQQYD